MQHYDAKTLRRRANTASRWLRGEITDMQASEIFGVPIGSALRSAIVTVLKRAIRADMLKLETTKGAKGENQ